MAEIEMLDIESNTTPTSYLTKILEFSKQSTPENSIVFDFEVDANYCHCKATRYDIDGSKNTVQQTLLFNGVPYDSGTAQISVNIYKKNGLWYNEEVNSFFKKNGKFSVLFLCKKGG